MSNSFKIGDKVSWTSQSGGFTRTKTGVIARIIKAGGRAPWEIANLDFPNHRRMFDGYRIPGTMPNDQSGQVGYLVEVRDGKTNKAKPKLYMPYPNKLTKA